MSRVLPGYIVARIGEIPRSFAPLIEDRGQYFFWRDSISMGGKSIALELGMRKAAVNAEAKLKAAIWQSLELARLKRPDLLTHCRVDRHKRG